MRVDCFLLSLIVAYSVYWAVFRAAAPATSFCGDPCTVQDAQGVISYFSKGTPCEWPEPCTKAECVLGTCTLIRHVPLREFQADIVLTQRGIVSASVVNGGCQPITRVVSMVLACQGDNYDHHTNATITIPANEARSISLPMWLDSVDKDLQCQLRYAGTTLNTTLHGVRNVPHSCFTHKTLPNDGQVITTAQPHDTPCFMPNGINGRCNQGVCTVGPWTFTSEDDVVLGRGHRIPGYIHPITLDISALRMDRPFAHRYPYEKPPLISYEPHRWDGTDLNALDEKDER